MHVKESLLFDWMKFGSYRLINYIWPYMAVPPSSHTPHLFHLVLDQLCPMDSVHFYIILVQHWNLIFSLWPARWTQLRMRDRVTSKRLTASTYLLIHLCIPVLQTFGLPIQYMLFVEKSVPHKFDQRCKPNTWSFYMTTVINHFYPRNPYEATGMVKRPWDQQVFQLCHSYISRLHIVK